MKQYIASIQHILLIAAIIVVVAVAVWQLATTVQPDPALFADYSLSSDQPYDNYGKGEVILVGRYSPTGTSSVGA